MDSNSILMSALIGAVCVGGAVGLGELLKKVTQKQFHQIITYGAIAVGVAAMTLTTNEYRNSRKASNVDAILAETFASDSFEGKMLKSIKEHFPDEYQDFLAEAANAKTGAEAEKIGFTLSSGIRKKHADKLYAVSSEKIATHFETEYELITMVSEVQGWEGCNLLLERGAGEFLEAEGSIADIVRKNGLRLFELIGEAKHQPTLREPASAEDWGVFLQHWLNSGESEESAKLFLEPDYQDPETCNVYLIFYRLLQNYDGELGDRLKTELLVLQAKG